MSLSQHIFYIGVDGGATKTTVRVEDEAGKFIGKECDGPGNIRISVETAWQSINAALNKILHSHGICLKENQIELRVGMGLAGCEIQAAYQAFVHTPHSFSKLVVSSDAHTACLGAHAGNDGAIIIVGTGVVGYQTQDGQSQSVGGHGFPQDDLGGGAWLGLQAVSQTLQFLDKRSPASGLTEAVYQKFNYDQSELVMWANSANSTTFAQLAPLVIQQSQLGDPAAIELLQQAAKEISRIGAALRTIQTHPEKSLPCSLVGGIAPFVEPLLNGQLRSRLVPCQYTADAGAIFLVKESD